MLIPVNNLMTLNSSDSNIISRQSWYSLGLPRSLQKVALVSILIVFGLGFINLIGRLFRFTMFKGIESHWMPMTIVTSVFFILSAFVLVLIQGSKSDRLRYWLSKIIPVIIFSVSLSTLIDYLIIISKNDRSLLSGIPMLGFLFVPENRMSLLTAIIFLFLGSILFLLSIKKPFASDLAHLLIFPAAIASYFIPISYILDVYSIPELPNITIALNTGLSFCALCLFILLIRPETWLMRVFTSRNLGGMMARRLFPGLLLLPVAIGWFRIKGERTEIFESEVGVVLVSLTYTVCFIWLIWLTARSVNRVDDKRHDADKALKKSFAELDIRVRERTSELKQAEADLKKLNVELEQKVVERTQDLESANVQLHRELTDRILAEEALKKSESQLKELNATKDKFFNIVAHDLKNPFTSLLGSSELLYQNINKMDQEAIRKLAAILNDSARGGYAILQNLLDWSRSQTGLLKINPERINIKNVIDEDISILEQFSANKKIEMYSEVKEDVYIFADKNMIKTILRNLLSNAVKFTRQFGKVVVSLIKEEGEIIISVRDTGVGISQANVEKLFRIDTKFSRPGTDNEQGTGLGLKLSKEFVEKQGGRIWVESVESEGSDFKFSIPITQG